MEFSDGVLKFQKILLSLYKFNFKKLLFMRRSIKFICDETKTFLKSHKGVYKLVNTKNGHFYVGSTDRDFNERFLEHCATYQKYKDGGKLIHPLLWRAYDKYGIKSFKIEIIEILDNATEDEIHGREGYYIRSLNPEYNICQEPELSGSPNKGRKLTEEWKQHIAEKSALYTHSPETLAIVTANNKANACKLKLYCDGELKLEFNSWVELANHFNLKSASGAKAAVKNGIKWHGFDIVRETTQMKKILVHFEDKDEIFDSFNKCDKALDMWRGYTSTIYNRGIKVLKDKYKYEVI